MATCCSVVVCVGVYCYVSCACACAAASPGLEASKPANALVVLCATVTNKFGRSCTSVRVWRGTHCRFSKAKRVCASAFFFCAGACVRACVCVKQVSDGGGPKYSTLPTTFLYYSILSTATKTIVGFRPNWKNQLHPKTHDDSLCTHVHLTGHCAFSQRQCFGRAPPSIRQPSSSRNTAPTTCGRALALLSPRFKKLCDRPSSSRKSFLVSLG